MFRTIKAIFFCLLSIALSFFCLGGVAVSFHFVEVQLDATSSPFLNGIIDRVCAYNLMLSPGQILIIGTVAWIFEIFFSKSMNDFFCDLPLGGFSEFDGIFAEGFKGLAKYFVSVISPALICSVYIMFTIIFDDIFPNPQMLNNCRKWLFPVALILVIIAILALLVSVIRYGGLWGVLVRFPLLLSINVCFCCIGGVLLFLAASLIICGSAALVALALFGCLLIVLIPMTLIALRGHTSR